MNDTPANATLAGVPPLDTARPGNHWTPARWLWIMALVFAGQLAFIFLAGEWKPVVPRIVGPVPALKLAGGSDPLLALNDPTLFARPDPDDFTTVGSMNIPGAKPLSFRWTEPPRWLPLTANDLGVVLDRFLQTNYPARQVFSLKPAPLFSSPAVAVEPLLIQNSTMQLEGELARRQLPSEVTLTNWPYPNVIAPSVVQLLVGPSGNVTSAVLLPPGNGYAGTDQYSVADQQALVIARNLRFAPAPREQVGRVTFRWHTVPPPPAVNAVE
jgi:hypothetical protein